ncbi:MAG TPA: cytochrome c biogenesis protein CcdA [Gemmatimonadales bacterium]
MLVAFAAGLLSFLSPCVLPLIPSYVGYLTGMSVDELQRRRGTAVLHGLWFVAGFSLVFVLLGAAASAVGTLLRDYQQWVARVGGVLLILFGIYLLGIVRPLFLMREWRVELARKPLGYFGSGLVGVTFGAAWTPCIGPILGGILTLAATSAGLVQGMGLLAVYALGLAIPFLVTALALDRFLVWFQRFRPYIVWVDRIAGVLLILLGVLLVTDSFTVLAGYLRGLTPAFLRERL